MNSRLTIASSPAYFRDSPPSSCTAGKRLVQLTPNDDVKPYAELPVQSGNANFKRVS